MNRRIKAMKWLVPIGLALPAAQASAATSAHAARVTIVRDDVGIAHIHGKTDPDAVFGMIYAQAEDDFPRIERNYLASLGRLAEVDGERSLWLDVRQRLFVDPARLPDEYRRSPLWLRRLMDAWAAGLNGYLADHPAVRPARITRFEPWMALAFSEGSIGGDIERGVDPARLAAFYGSPGVAMATPSRLAATDAGRLIEPKGSNGIAIGPSRSASGHPLLWINPHTSFFFRAEQQVTSGEGLSVYGAATWGQFFVYQGFNRHLGWMHTSSGVDNIDEFAVEVRGQGRGARWRDGTIWRPFARRTVRLMVRASGGALRERVITTLATRHGPVIRREGRRWIAVAMLNAPRPALEQSWLRTKAKTLRGYLTVAERKANSSNNTILAADDGTIAYLHPQFVPVRDARFDYTRPVDGSDPATAWRGLHQLSQLPQVVRPRSGWVMNVNDAPWSAAGADSPRESDFPRYMDQFGTNPRTVHAVAVLSGNRRFTPETLRGAAFDPFLPLFDQQIPLLTRGFASLPASDPRRAELRRVVDMLAGWDRRWGLESVATTIAVYWGEALWRREGPKAEVANRPIFAWLADTTTDADRIAALEDGWRRLRADFGGPVAWGRVNRFQRLDGAIALRFDDRAPSVPVPFTSSNFGSLAAFGVERQAGQRCVYGTSGNSFVAMVEFTPQGPRAWSVSAGGQSGDPASPHFDDQAARYAAGALRAIPLGSLAGRPYHPGEPRPAEPARPSRPLGLPCGQ